VRQLQNAIADKNLSVIVALMQDPDYADRLLPVTRYISGRSGTLTANDWNLISLYSGKLQETYSNERLALSRLLRTNDWEILTGPQFWPQDADISAEGSRLSGLLLMAWADRLILEGMLPISKSKLADKLMDKLLAMKQWLYRDDMLDMLGFSLQTCSESRREQFVKYCHSLFLAQAKTGDPGRRLSLAVLSLAVKQDEAAATPYVVASGFISNCVAEIMVDPNTNRASAVLSDLSQYCLLSENPGFLLKKFTSNLLIITNREIMEVAQEARMKVARWYLRRGSEFRRLDPQTTDYLVLRSNLDEALLLDPTNSDALHSRGLINELIDDLDAAEADMRMAAKLKTPGRVRAASAENLSLVYLKRKQWEQILENCKSVNELLGFVPFSARDILNPSSFISKLRKAQDPVAEFLTNHLSEPFLKLLNNYKTEDDSSWLQEPLARELNSVVQGSLYETNRFAKIDTDGAFQKQFEKKPHDGLLFSLNRELLERAFPDEIATRQKLEAARQEPLVWNTILQLIAADKLGREEIKANAKKAIGLLVSTFDIVDLKQYLPKEYHEYVEQARNWTHGF
jgi:hypothetical protein